MKKTISILILLILIPTLCFAGALQEKQRQVIAKKNVSAPAGPIACASYTGLACEDFDGATSCYSGYTSNCQKTIQYAPDATVDFDASSTTYGMYGTYCLTIPASGNRVRTDNSISSTTDPTYFLLSYRSVGGVCDGTWCQIFTFRSVGGDTLSGGLYIKSDGKYCANASECSSAGAIEGDTTYWFRGKYQKGTSSNATFAVSKWSGSAWDDYITNATGSGTENASGYLLNNSDGTHVNVFDILKFSASEFTNAPTTY